MTARDATYRSALRVYRVLPTVVRRAVARLATPRYALGAVAVLRCDEEILMLRQRHHRGWALPGGLLGRGETPREALVRELCEELGLEVDVPTSPQHVRVDPRTRWVDVIFVVELTERPEVHVDGTEVIEAAWRRPGQSGVSRPTAAQLAHARLASSGPAPGAGTDG